ncbi:MAG TPA: glycosyltransferase family A protein [Candidatus Limnocylindria bacterium]|nr:glycosyltransferase family A protein [Candidatus Limnocylindria bacterium]
MQARPPLSVVVPTRDGWPKYKPYFEHHRREIDSVGGELLVLDGTNLPPPPADLIGPNVRWISKPGESVMGLRALGYPEARGEIVGVSEDHTRVPVGWAAAILECHAEHPEAAAIGGSVENGTSRSYVEWADFLCGHDREIPSVGQARRVGLCGLTNVSYKRDVIRKLRPLAGIGVNDAIFQRELAREGATLLVDDRITCKHEQALSFKAATRLLYHAGRMGAGGRRQRMNPAEVLRIVVTPLSPLLLTARLGLWLAARRHYRARYLVEVPAIAWFYGARAVGELVGYAAGPGKSALLLH